MNKGTYIAVHHTAVRRTSSPQLYAVNRYHRDKWNMKSRLGWYVGYNYFIDVDGTVTQTRAWNEETIAQKGYNCDLPERCTTISICLADNYNESMWVDPVMDDALMRLIAEIKKTYPNIKVVGHRDLQADRTCPGANISPDDIKEWNETPLDDPVDQEKAEKIKQLQATLDRALAALRKLLALLNGRK